jgi:hypothetical protein
MPRRLVGGRLNGGWDGEPPIHGAVRPDQTRGESCHTRPRERIWRAAGTIERGRREGNSGDFFLRRVSDRRRGIATFAPGHWKTGRRESQNIVVSARGWLVVNPVGVATPTVGWKRAPLSAVASIAIITSDKYFAYVAYRNCILTHMFIEL